MGKTMTVKDLLKLYDPIVILKEISKNYGTLYFEDTCAIFDTYDELLNEDDDPIHRDYSSKYRLILDIVFSSESKKELIEAANSNMPIDSRIARYLFYILENNGKHYKISKRYVKSIRDFSLCSISIPDSLTKLDCACLVVLSFAVLNEKIIKCHGELSSHEYIQTLRTQADDE